LKSLSFFSVALFSEKYYINIMRKAVKNMYAKELAERKYQPRIVRARKGKGSYDRKRLEKRYA
jgi:stalled ribosome alternative rescue factor ArfA